MLNPAGLYLGYNTKIIFALLSAILLSGCRTSRQTVLSDTIADNLSISADSTFSISRDSNILLKNVKMQTDDAIEFVGAGGTIRVSTDGTLAMFGVAAVRSSRLRSSERRMETGRTDMQAHSKESVVATHHAASYSESKPMAPPATYGWKLKCAVLVLIALMIIMLISKIKKKLFFNN